ncbi:LON peptidase substrate-binding domain-containing protein [Kiritimatiellota bacterium B12222]|nr:LON peptidase substrate-binding domain-containing protein [Kiritimatiellota bacterium B12222]
MSDASIFILPLFPVPMMVLPGEVAALHIFEPRYREMVTYCRQTPQADGDFILQYKEEERSSAFATAVRILKVIHEHEDGRLDILVEGMRRVEIVDRLQLHLYHSAKYVEVEDEAEDWDNELANQVYAMHRQLLVTVTGDEPADSFYQQEGGISFKVAACSGMNFRSRAKLLKTRDETERLQMVLDHLQCTLPLIQAVLPQMHSIAGTYALSQGWIKRCPSS